MKYFIGSMIIILLFSASYQVLLTFFITNLFFMLIPVLSSYVQIAYNVYKGNNPGFNPAYVIGLLGSRLIMSFYYSGCPENVFM